MLPSQIERYALIWFSGGVWGEGVDGFRMASVFGETHGYGKKPARDGSAEPVSATEKHNGPEGTHTHTDTETETETETRNRRYRRTHTHTRHTHTGIK